MLTRSVRAIRVRPIRVRAIRVIGAIVIGAIEVWVPKEVKAPVARAVVVVAMAVVVMLPLGTLRHTRPVLQGLSLEMLMLVKTRPLVLDTASVTATLSPR
jgi:hypothetical protein